VRSRAVAREIALVYLGTALVTLLVSHTPGRLIGLFGHLILASAFLGGALYLARGDPRGPVHYGIDLAGVLEARPDEPEHAGLGLWFTLRRAIPSALSELLFALLVAAVLFPPFILGFRLWHGVEHVFTFHPPRAPFDFVLTHLVAIALPEEALFRGYFQTRLSDVFTRRRRVLGAELSLVALTSQAVLFAVLHFLVGFAPARLAVFFPALVFGWLRARRGGIGAAVWFHALCNVLAELLTRGYL
jgi:uncharacterized protein